MVPEAFWTGEGGGEVEVGGDVVCRKRVIDLVTMLSKWVVITE